MRKLFNSRSVHLGLIFFFFCPSRYEQESRLFLPNLISPKVPLFEIASWEAHGYVPVGENGKR